MSTPNDGGPAFPHGDQSVWSGTGGMSLRDWMAGQALAGMMPKDGGGFQQSWFWYAEASYLLADAMLAARQCPTATDRKGEAL